MDASKILSSLMNGCILIWNRKKQQILLFAMFAISFLHDRFDPFHKRRYQRRYGRICAVVWKFSSRLISLNRNGFIHIYVRNPILPFESYKEKAAFNPVYRISCLFTIWYSRFKPILETKSCDPTWKQNKFHAPVKGGKATDAGGNCLPWNKKKTPLFLRKSI